MKQFFLSITIALTVISLGCGSKPVENNVNVPEPAASPQPVAIADLSDAGAALAEGNRLMDENDTDNAIAAYRKAIELNPDLPEPYFKLGIAYGLVEMQMEQAGQAADTVDSKGKTRSEKEFEKAVDVYKKWLDKNPDDDVAHYNLGRVYVKLFKDDEAAKEFKLAVKLKPEDSEYQTELGASLIKLAQYHEAIPPLKKAIELDSGNERAISMLEDAEAGRQRLDYVAKNSNTSNSNTAAKYNAANRRNDANVNANVASVGSQNTNSQQPKAKPTPARTPKPNSTRPL